MTTNDKKSGLSYADAGVNIEQANALVEEIKGVAKSTHRPGVMTGIGGFGGLFELPLDRYQQPILVSGTDGVGTKLKLAKQLQQFDTIGIDLVAMCVNDIITLGAEPLFFLDYYATGQLDNVQAAAIIRGIGTGCQQAGAALIGGETAEMPGLYRGSEFDLAGFCVGIVEKSKIIDGSKVQAGDQLIAVASSGVHSNGYSLVRRVIADNESKLDAAFDDTTLGATLLTPTRIYAKAVQALLEKIDVHAIAHITGGGLLENIPRVLPANTQAVIHENSWEWPGIFQWLQTRGNIAQSEMYRTFNCGVGLVIAVAAEDLAASVQSLQQHGENAWHIGEVIASDDTTPRVNIQ